MKTVAFVWENFGPIHIDRCESVAAEFKEKYRVVGIEIFGSSDVYPWVAEAPQKFRKITIFSEFRKVSGLARCWATVRACLRTNAAEIFFCNYERGATLMAAVALKIAGRRVFVMNDSKFDDYPRHLWREVGKSVFYLPYSGALASGIRSVDYLRFLGFPSDRVIGTYNVLSLERIRSLAGEANGFTETPFEQRHFSIVARLVPKKNIATAIRAYRYYVDTAKMPRSLRIYGSGPLEGDLRALVEELGLQGGVHFEGFLQSPEICGALGNTLALILPSSEEQFGNVVIEAQALGVPVIISTNCGARDSLVRTGVNGFIVEPDNAEGIAYFMRTLGDDYDGWRRMSEQASRFVENGDAKRFAEAVQRLIGRGSA